MTVSPDFRDYVLDLLEPLGRVRARAMFGGAGLYLDDTFFAILANDVLYLKADERNRGEFEAAGAAPFKPFADKPHTMSYYEAPADVMEESDELCAWARRAWEAARRGGSGRPRVGQRRHDGGVRGRRPVNHDRAARQAVHTVAGEIDGRGTGHA